MGDEAGEPRRDYKIKAFTRYRLIAISLCALLVVIAGVIIFLFVAHGTTDSLVASFRAPQHAVDFPLYYPSALPSYYFVDSGSIQTDNDVVIFPISRNDGKKILVTEQSLPSDFSLNNVNGLQHQLPGIGTAVIGSGFLGNRAVIKTSQTVIFLSSPQEISITDLQSIAYNFKQLN